MLLDLPEANINSIRKLYPRINPKRLITDDRGSDRPPVRTFIRSKCTGVCVKVDESSPGTRLLQHLASGKGAESGIRGDHVGNCFCGDSQLDESCQQLHSSPNGRTTLAGSEEAVSGDCCEASTPRNLAGGSGGFFCGPPVGLTIEELWLTCQRVCIYTQH